MRRVVITGLGMVTPLACGVEATWEGIIAGKSGIKHVESFDVSDLPCRIAGIIPRGDGSNGTYNPDQWMEPKEQRKVDHFIVYAMAAAKQAVADSGWKAETDEDSYARQERCNAALAFSYRIEKKQIAGKLAEVNAEVECQTGSIVAHQYQHKWNRIRHDTGNP